jgi:hypothetical protein
MEPQGARDQMVIGDRVGWRLKAKTAGEAVLLPIRVRSPAPL